MSTKITSPQARQRLAQSAAVLWRTIEHYEPCTNNPYPDRLVTADTPCGNARFSFYMRDDKIKLRFWTSEWTARKIGHDPFRGIATSLMRAAEILRPHSVLEDELSNGVGDMFTLIMLTDSPPKILQKDSYDIADRLGPNPQLRPMRAMSNHEILHARGVIKSLQDAVDVMAEKMQFPAPQVYDPLDPKYNIQPR